MATGVLPTVNDSMHAPPSPVAIFPPGYALPALPPAPPPAPNPPNAPQNIPPVPQPQGDDLRLEGREPPVFTGNRTTTDAFIHELKLYQFLNSDHPLIANEAT